MTLLTTGLALWIGAHFFKRLAPNLAENMGEKRKALMALLILAGVVLMVIGYRAAPFAPVYTPLPGIGHVNNLLMLVAVFFFGIGQTKGLLTNKIRHPMLWGMVIWAGAHLLVNGDQASLVLFGGLAGWALITMAIVNRASAAWVPPAGGTIVGDVKNLVVTLVIYALAAGVHIWLGHSPFLGTYG